MKIILTGATGVLGSHIMYEILEHFFNTKIEGKLYLISRDKGKVLAKDRIQKLLSSSYTPKSIKKKSENELFKYVEILDDNFSEIQNNYSQKIKGAYFIHSAGYVNLSTDESLKEKIFQENTLYTKTIFSAFSPYICKFIYISTAFSSGERTGLINNDFHNLNFEPKFRNAYENAKYESEKFVIQQCGDLKMPFQILRPSVIGGKMMGEENPYFISKFMVFYLLAKFFYFAAIGKKQQQNIRFIVDSKTGLNIIPVDYVAKVIATIFTNDAIQQLNIVNHASFNILEGLHLIMDEVGYTHFSTVANTEDFSYQNTIERLYYESIGKHLKPYFIAEANEYDTTLLDSLLAIPTVDSMALTKMISFAKLQNFVDVDV